MNLPFWRKLHVVMMMAGFTHGGIYTQNLHAGFTHDGGFYTRKLHAEITHGGGKYTWYHDPASPEYIKSLSLCFIFNGYDL